MGVTTTIAAEFITVRSLFWGGNSKCVMTAAITDQISEKENPPPPPPKKKNNLKSSSEQVFLNNFRWVPDSCHREGGKSLRELFEKVRTNEVLFVGISGFWVGFSASKISLN